MMRYNASNHPTPGLKKLLRFRTGISPDLYENDDKGFFNHRYYRLVFHFLLKKIQLLLLRKKCLTMTMMATKLLPVYFYKYELETEEPLHNRAVFYIK